MELPELLTQGNKIDDMLDEVDALLLKRREAFDRITHVLQSSFTFLEGQNTMQEMVLNVPEGNDFEATRFMLYADIRAVVTDTATQGPDDKVFRPTGWVPDFLNDAVTETPELNTAVDALVELDSVDRAGKSHPYQNAGWFASQAFGGSVMRRPETDMLGGVYNRTETPGGLVWNPFFLLPAGTAMKVKVTPLFSGPRQAVATNVTGADGRFRVDHLRVVGAGAGFAKIIKGDRGRCIRVERANRRIMNLSRMDAISPCVGRGRQNHWDRSRRHLLVGRRIESQLAQYR